MLTTVSKYLDQHADRFLEELKEFLRIPTVSAELRAKNGATRSEGMEPSPKSWSETV